MKNLVMKFADETDGVEVLQISKNSNVVHGDLVNDLYGACSIVLPWQDTCLDSTDQYFVSNDSLPTACGLSIIIAGPPAAEKGTQSELLKKDYDLLHISTGDLLRSAVADETPLGLLVKNYMDNAQLVPDSLIIDVVVDRLQQKESQERGWLLDGFPRTEKQAFSLSEAGHFPDLFILLNVSQELLVERVTGRRMDPVTGNIYHLKYNPPPDATVAARLVQRDDDTEEKIVRRYSDFVEHMPGIKDFYHLILLEVNGSESKWVIYDTITKKLNTILETKNCSINKDSLAQVEDP